MLRGIASNANDFSRLGFVKTKGNGLRFFYILANHNAPYGCHYKNKFATLFAVSDSTLCPPLFFLQSTLLEQANALCRVRLANVILVVHFRGRDLVQNLLGQDTLSCKWLPECNQKRCLLLPRLSSVLVRRC